MQLPHLADTDTYKLSHFQMYPASKSLTAYFCFRGPLNPDDHRIVFAGARYIYEQILSRRITSEDITQMDQYTTSHMAGGSQFNWPRDLWVKVVEEYDGYIPLKVRSLRDGETIYPQIPGMIFSAKRGINQEEFDLLCTWFETQFMRMWNQATTATKSAHVRQFLKRLYETTVDIDQRWRLDYALHDFGARGVSSKETAMTAGLGHLMVFDGTDNIISGIKASSWNHTNVGQSVIASEHSVMTSWPTEREALQRLIDITPEGAVLSCVADTYDYSNFAWNIVPDFVDQIKAKGIHFVLRPDSGDPVEAVLEGLRAMDAAFGSSMNDYGYLVINGAGVIQGDGIDAAKLRVISQAVVAAGYSIQNVVFGMGGGLLQKQNRDTLKCAIKLCERVDLNGNVLPIMKAPKTDPSKGSIPGDMQVNLVDGIPKIYPTLAGWENTQLETDLLEVIWDSGPVGYTFESFSDMRARHRRTWDARPAKADVISPIMKEKIQRVREEILNRT